MYGCMSLRGYPVASPAGMLESACTRVSQVSLTHDPADADPTRTGDRGSLAMPGGAEGRLLEPAAGLSHCDGAHRTSGFLAVGSGARSTSPSACSPNGGAPVSSGASERTLPVT